MKRSETTYDTVNNLLLEYATLVCAVAEIPSNDRQIHRAKRDAILNLRDATRAIILDMVEKKVVNAVKVSSN